MSISKFFIVSMICVLLVTGCQQNVPATVEAAVVAAAAATVEALPTHTPRPTLTPQPTFTPLLTYTPVGLPTTLPTLTPRPTYTPNPTYSPVDTSASTPAIAPAATNPAAGTVAANSNPTSAAPGTVSTFNAALIQVTYAQMSQIIKSVSGYEETYEDDDPNDLQSGEGGRQKIPVNCSAAIDQFQQLLQLEVNSIDSQNPNEQAALALYRQAWDQYMDVAMPIIARCQTAVTNNETLDTLGPDLYDAATAALFNDINALINQAIYALGENQ